MKALVLMPALLALALTLPSCGGSGEATDHYKAGLALQGGGKLEDAIQEYDAALRLDPKHVPAYNSRGRAYHYLGKYQRAIEDFNSAIQLDPRLALAYHNRGLAYFNFGQYPEALRDSDAAIRLDPRLADAYARRAMANTMLGNDAAVPQDIARAVELGFDRQFLDGAIASLMMQR